MKRFLYGVAFIAAFSAHAATDPRDALTAGAKAYGAKQFNVAEQAFAQAATNAAAEKLDPAVARYNSAAAAYRLGQMDVAADRLAEALRTGDLKLQQKAWFNRGDALLGRMNAQEQQGKLEDAQKTAQEAATHFEQAILLDPTDADAKVNYELCLQLQQELEKKKQEQQKQQDQQKKDQDKDKDKDKNKQDQQDKQQQKPEPGKDKDKDKDKDEDKDKQDQQKSKSDEQKKQEQQAAQAAKKDGEMTPEEAMQLLNAMRQEEQANRDKMRLNLGQPEPVEKDW